MLRILHIKHSYRFSLKYMYININKTYEYLSLLLRKIAFAVCLKQYAKKAGSLMTWLL